MKELERAFIRVCQDLHDAGCPCAYGAVHVHEDGALTMGFLFRDASAAEKAEDALIKMHAKTHKMVGATMVRRLNTLGVKVSPGMEPENGIN